MLFFLLFVTIYAFIFLIVPYYVFVRPAKWRVRIAFIAIYAVYCLLPSVLRPSLRDALLLWVATAGAVGWIIGALCDRRAKNVS